MLQWGGGQNILSGMNQGGCMIVSQTELKKKMKGDIKVIQCSNKAVEVRIKNEATPESDFQIIMTLGMNIKGIDVFGNFTLFWNGKYAQIYEVHGDKNPVMSGTFESSSTVMALHEENIY